MSNSANKQNMIDSLGTLVRLRTTEVDRLQADMASQEATRTRFQNNLARMDALTASSGPTGSLVPGGAPGTALALALNCGAYKQNVMAMADLHRTDLALHEANMAVSQRKLTAAWTRRELLGKVLEQQETQLSRAQERVARKREDDIATQSWMAGRTA